MPSGEKKAGCSAGKTMLKIHFLKAGKEEIERSGQKGNNRSLSIHVKIPQATDLQSSSLSHQKGEEGSVGLLHVSWHVIYPTGKSFENIQEPLFFLKNRI